ncbi:MAG: glycosyltransferase family 2 protein [Planctomycetota bacterium]|nr:glycosyltransferase family 2 protein [Planctomycetota bacterium]
MVQPDEPRADGRLSSRGVTIIVPAYNEEKGICGVVERLSALDLGVPTEILVVDDGSTDATTQRLRELEPSVPGLRVIRQEVNRGYGAALKIGFARAVHEVIVITDADGTYPEDRIVDLIACVDDGADMAVGARRGEDVHIPLVRRPAKALLGLLASYLAGERIPDLNSGLRAFRRGFVQTYRPILPQGFSFTTTSTLAALTNHHRVDYVSINYAHRKGSSKIRPIRDTLGFLSLIVRTVLYFNPLKVFYPVAGVLFLAFLGSLVYDVFISSSEFGLGDKTVLLFVAFLQIMGIGLLADLIEKRSRL